MKTYYVDGNVCYLDFRLPTSLKIPGGDLEVNIFTCNPEMIDESQLPGINSGVLYEKISSADEYTSYDYYVDLNVIVIDSKESEVFIDLVDASKAISFILVSKGYDFNRDVKGTYVIKCWDNTSSVLYHAVCVAFYAGVLKKVSNID
ncbi:hypothetical protein [Serratia sp. UGAL515B_01]|uniref:hypothetical protein n=1 Tax=Serratia sp. UGAL515B_01 TaxID=2986763 RepID=UPI002953B547|nr:hypothetical protein [Serratia sp. UGAL515B_01]WON75844.1 hypothetical protein OK023_11220 [Serratia sp. UGAL515B_01]